MPLTSFLQRAEEKSEARTEIRTCQVFAELEDWAGAGGVEGSINALPAPIHLNYQGDRQMRKLALIIGVAILVAPYGCSALAGSVNGFVCDRAMTASGKTISACSHSPIATGMVGQKEKAQKAVDQQPGTKEKQAAPSQSQPGSLVTRMGLKAEGNNTGRCPLTVNFTGFITTNGPGVVQYTFIRSDGIAGPVLSARFKDA